MQTGRWVRSRRSTANSIGGVFGAHQLTSWYEAKEQLSHLCIQVFVGGKLLGGSTEALAGLADGSLQAQVQAAERASQPALPEALRALVDAALPAPLADSSEAAGQEGAERKELEATAAQLQAARLGCGAGTTFSFNTAVQLGQEACGLQEAAAVELLAKLQAAQLLTVASSGSSSEQDLPLSQQLLEQQPGLQLGLVADVPLPAKLQQPLNAHFRWFGPSRPASQVATGPVLRAIHR